MSGLRVDVVPGVGEVTEGTDLAALLDATALDDGDVVVVTSKVVSKAEGRVTDVPREQAMAEEAVRVVARRGPTSIVRTRHGLVMAAAGIDASNVAPGRLVLLPRDPDASARALRRTLAHRRGVNVAVVVTDTAGRAWRVGQTDIAVGAAGLVVADDHAGRHDAYGNPLAVTLPAVADEVAGAAELATGKLTMSPLSVVRGLARHVLPPGHDGPGAAALVRGEGEDMFGLGSREAVVAALAGPHPAFGHALPPGDLAAVLDAGLASVPGGALTADLRTSADRVVVDLAPLSARDRGRAEVVVTALAAAHGWRTAERADARTVLAPTVP